MNNNLVDINLVDVLKKYINIQQSLISDIREKYGKLDQFLFSIPNRGSISSCGSDWNFQKHGVGIRFIDNAGVTVDAHCAIDNPIAFDAWRISTYLLSIGLELVRFKSNEYKVNDKQIGIVFSEMVDMGLIKHDPMSDCYLIENIN